MNAKECVWCPGNLICSYGFSYSLYVKTPKSISLAQTSFFESYLNIHLLTLYLQFILQNPQIQHTWNFSHLSVKHLLPSVFGHPVSGATHWPTSDPCGNCVSPPDSLLLDEVSHQGALMPNARTSVYLEAPVFFHLAYLLTVSQLWLHPIISLSSSFFPHFLLSVLMTSLSRTEVFK